MANAITMLDVFRSMHSMNVEDVRQLFVTNFHAIIAHKDAIISEQKSRIQTLEQRLSDSKLNRDYNYNAKLTENMVNKAEMDAKLLRLQSEKTSIQAQNAKIYSEAKELIDKQQLRIQNLKDLLDVTNKTLKTEIATTAKLNAEMSALKEEKAKYVSSNQLLNIDCAKCGKQIDDLKKRNANQKKYIKQLQNLNDLTFDKVEDSYFVGTTSIKCTVPGCAASYFKSWSKAWAHRTDCRPPLRVPL